MSEAWDINCEKCGELIVTEERERIGGNLKHISGSYENGFYDGENDKFYCLKCAAEQEFINK